MHHLVFAVGQRLGFIIDRRRSARQRKTKFVRCAAGEPQISAAVLTEGVGTVFIGLFKAAADAFGFSRAVGLIDAAAQQHDVRNEQNRRKAAGGKKERSSPFLLFNHLATQLMPAENFLLVMGLFCSGRPFCGILLSCIASPCFASVF